MINANSKNKKRYIYLTGCFIIVRVNLRKFEWINKLEIQEK